MKLRRIDHVGVVVADLPAHVAQLEAMGLVLERVGDNIESHALYYPCGDASVELIEVRDPLIAAKRLGEGEQARIEHIAFEVDDLRRGARPAGVARRRGLVAAVPVGLGDDDLDDGRDQRRCPVPVPGAAGRRGRGRVRIGLIGAGAIARRHVGGAVRLDGVELAAVCDSDRARAASMAAGAAVYGAGRSCWSSRWTRCSCAPLPLPMRSLRSPRCDRGSRSTWRSRWRGRSADGEAIVGRMARERGVCAVGYQWRSLGLVRRRPRRSWPGPRRGC